MSPPKVWLSILLRGFLGKELYGPLWRGGAEHHTSVAPVSGSDGGADAGGSRLQVQKLTASSRSSHRLDVLVEAEEVGWIIPVLQGHQPRILRGAVGRSDPVCALLAQAVDVDAA